MNSNSITWRLGIPFTILIAMTIGAGWVGLDRMGRMSAEVNHTLEKRYGILQASQDALANSGVNNRITMQVFLLQDKKEIDRLLAQRATNSERISALIKVIETRIDSEKEKQLLSVVKEKRSPYIESYSRALSLLLKENNLEGAHHVLIDETLPRLVAYHAAWGAFVDFQAAQSQEAGLQLNARYLSARRMVIGLVSCAVLLAFIIAVLATRAIAREISARQRMQTALQQAGELLEERVKQRTLELSNLNAELLTEIEQRKQAEIASRESDAKFRAIFEGSNDAILLFSGKGFCDCNPRTLDMFGFERKEDFLGLDPVDLSPEIQPNGVDSTSAAHKHIECAYEAGHTRFEWRHKRADGVEFPADVLLSSFEYKGERLIQATVRDLTGRMKMEATLAQERDRFQNLMELMPDAIYFKDRQSRFVLVNHAFAQTAGISSAVDAIGKTDSDFFGKEHSSKAFRDEQDLMTTGKPILDKEEREDHIDGRVTWVSSTKVPLRGSKGQITGLVGISRDISERKRAETASLESARKYQTLIESVSDWVWESDAKRQFVYSNPKVNAVLGYEIDETIGRSICDFLPGVEQPRITALFETLEQGNQSETIFDCLCLHNNGNAVTLEMNVGVILDETGRVRGFRGVARDVTERRRFEEELRKLSRALDQSPASVLITDTYAKIEYVNSRFCEVTGYTPQEVLGQTPKILKSGANPREMYVNLWEAITNGREWRGEICNRKKNGEVFWESAVISPLKNERGVITHYLQVKEDISERKRLEKERETMEIQLRQAQKLESVGQLAAGIAHEINTPIQYVGDNLRFIRESFDSLRKVITAYEGFVSNIPAETLAPEASAAIEAVVNENDIPYLVGEIPTAIQQSLDGVQRVADIVRAMKEFSHPGGKERTATDINHSIQTTITVARNEWKYVADVVTELVPDLPLVPCYQDEFNQVILNLLVNAAHAIGDVVKKSGGKGTIRIATKRSDSWVEIRVEDTGTGIPEENRHRIFELFFTTKEVGKGTGQGLALARSVIVKKHGGELTFESSVGKGTTFIIRMPLGQPSATETSERN